MRTLVVFSGPDREIRYEADSEAWNVERLLDDWSLAAMMPGTPHYLHPADRGSVDAVTDAFVAWAAGAGLSGGGYLHRVSYDIKPDQIIMVRCRANEGFLIGVRQEEH